MLFFSKLEICITDAVNRMKSFQKFNAIDVEDPIRIFLVGAKFRQKPDTGPFDSNEN